MPLDHWNVFPALGLHCLVITSPKCSHFCSLFFIFSICCFLNLGHLGQTLSPVHFFHLRNLYHVDHSCEKTNLLLTAPKPTNLSISLNTYIVHTMIIPSNYNSHSPVAHIRPWVLPRPQPCKPFAISPNLCWQHWIRPTRPPHDGSPACRA